MITEVEQAGHTLRGEEKLLLKLSAVLCEDVEGREAHSDVREGSFADVDGL